MSDSKNIQNKRDHFVSQFLLRNFSIDKNQKKGLTYLYKYPDFKPEEKSISKKVGNEVDFYLAKNKITNQSDKLADSVYQLLEQKKHAPRVLSKIVADSDYIKKLDYTEESILASLIAHQLTRTPGFRKIVNELIAYLLTSDLVQKEQLGDVTFLDEVIVANKFNVKKSDLKNQKQSNILTGARSHEIHIALAVAELIAPKMYQKNISVIEVSPDSYFVLSDSGVVVSGTEDDLLQVDDLWGTEKDDGLSFILPICPSKALNFSEHTPERTILKGKTADSLAVLINSISISTCDKEFYSHCDSFVKDYLNDLISSKSLKQYHAQEEYFKKHPFKKLIYLSGYSIYRIKKFIKSIIT
jgi:hypothetical protein